VSNQAANSLYEGYGFSEMTVRAGYYPDGEDARVMHLHLPEGPSEELRQDQPI
jgi:ribosomal protein S18 acetylase RimI-like enzyme